MNDHFTTSQESFASIIDSSKSIHAEAVKVICGGESQWAAAVRKILQPPRPASLHAFDQLILLSYPNYKHTTKQQNR